MNLEERLRQALSSHAERVDVAQDALASIRTRVDRSIRLQRRLTMSLAAIATSAAASVTAVLVGLGACTPPSVPPTPADTSTVTTPAPSDSATLEPAPTSASVPAYFVAEVRFRPVLYREFRTVSLPDAGLPARIRAALALSLAGEALDSDYGTAWPATASVRSVSVDSGVAVVDLGGARQNSVGSEYAYAAIQQLVWTVTAVAADFGAPLSGVRLRFDGQTLAELWGHVGGLDRPLTRADAMATLAPVWLISPQQGDTVGHTISVHVNGTVFEATMVVLVRNATGAELVRKSVLLDAGPPARGEARVSISLPASAPAGSYTIEAFFLSAADGSVQGMDDHVVTVG